MNFILPLLAAWMRMGTSWGSLGPNIPWGRIAVVKKLLLGSFALSTSCREKKITKSGEKGWKEKHGLVTYSKNITKGGGCSPISLGRHQWENYCPSTSLQRTLPLFPSLLPLLFKEKTRQKSVFIIEHLMNWQAKDRNSSRLSFNTIETRGALKVPSLHEFFMDMLEIRRTLSSSVSVAFRRGVIPFSQQHQALSRFSQASLKKI